MEFMYAWNAYFNPPEPLSRLVDTDRSVFNGVSELSVGQINESDYRRCFLGFP